MTVFDDILPVLGEIFSSHAAAFSSGPTIYINRDLNARVRLIVDDAIQSMPSVGAALHDIAREMHARLGAHAYPPEQALLWEADTKSLFGNQSSFEIEGCPHVRVIDRLAVEGNWSTIAPMSLGPPRIVFFSIKGGVGRSTALAATAWKLAEQGRRVLVLDLDLESPGLSSSLLPDDRRPSYGIADWLVEDLVNNGEAILDGMIASSDLSRDGDINVVPAHGRDPGEYLAKLGRVWMPKVSPTGERESWPQRLSRLLDMLEAQLKPDIVLVDSRSGIDEVASACLTTLGASLILLFALDGDQTWSGYRIIFQHWRKIGVAPYVRTRLQVVGSMIPEIRGAEYLDELRESAWNVFSAELYDEIPAGAEPGLDEAWSFDRSDETAPHAPWPVRWHRGLAALTSLYGGLQAVDPSELTVVFGPLVSGMANLAVIEPSPL
ncbi:ParA family protein [Rhodopila globiformis]|uniref:CobQ/CobB/MinD/ParA nucleotide binding domain-containing protein n=1 Tax=Rhodopila globiformis TaxID=1071 RepID=A0A2S6N0L0_RHOGL|nr:ParA family protein [Rhodopila globiformis]PPQ28130.1 hypothetical protein CCS01_25135 [Rhodopila globiformis]